MVKRKRICRRVWRSSVPMSPPVFVGGSHPSRARGSPVARATGSPSSRVFITAFQETIAAQRESGIEARAQAVYELQLAGYEVERACSHPTGRTTFG
jgi:hypothetical protein